MKRAILLGLVLLGLVLPAACLTPTEGAPTALRQYLSELKGKQYQAAYDRTQFAQLAHSFAPAAPLSFDHFKAFYERNPLKRYVIRHVARLERRSFEFPKRPGTPFYEVDVDLTYQSGTHVETFTIEGNGVVTVEPDRVFVRSSRRLKTVRVDGVSTRIALAEGATNIYAILVIQGPHELRIGSKRIDIGTNPLRVLRGKAKVVSAANAGKLLDVG